MDIPGRVENGVVVLEGPMTLPEGTPVLVSERMLPVLHTARQQKPVVLPLVPSDQPGSIDLTNERIAELLDQEDASS